ncbi:unnamed protein product [Pleuronectes platessa]|uniref:Uncharacterized protein n=1 Tax=Pleuronectes platessa TaxID=8262 RepID=A0A9N7UZP5_PLEPL|nr:unnamed protein product [Pleuronectes platessa]
MHWKLEERDFFSSPYRLKLQIEKPLRSKRTRPTCPHLLGCKEIKQSSSTALNNSPMPEMRRRDCLFRKKEERTRK